MRINSVYLKNFRVHSELNIEFSSGMNLLLGQNGSGKSSILEAIGVTLFSSKYRSSKGQEQVIRFGEKEAVVKIEFVGNDEVTYIIEKQFKKGSGYNRLYRKEDKEDILDISKEIEEKLKVLVGIDGELGGIYEDIIVSKQNEFINIYKQTAAKRKETFNKIFETDIYTKICDEFSLTIKKEYSKKVEKIEIEIGTLNSRVENPEELKSEIELKKEKKNSELEVLNSKKKIKDEIENKIQEIELLEKKIKDEEYYVLSEKQKQESSMEKLEKLEKEIETSKKSKEIVNREKESFNRYISVSEEISSEKRELKNIEKKVYEHGELDKKLNEIEKDITETENQEKIFQGTIEEKEKSLEKLLVQRKNQELKLEELEKETSRFQKLVLELEPKILESTELQKELKVREEQLNISSVKFDDIKLSLEKKNQERKEKGELEELEKNISLLEKKTEEKSSLEREISKNIALIEQNRDAEKQLKGGQCPYLGENCKNLEEFQGEEYFRVKEKELESQVSKLKIEVEKLAKEIAVLEDLKTTKVHIQQLDRDILQLESEVREKESEKNLKQEKLKNISLEIELFSEKNGDLETLKEKKIELTQDLKNLQREEKEEELKESLKEIQSYEKEIKTLKEKIEILKEKIEKKIFEQSSCKNLLKELSDFLPVYKSKKEIIEKKEVEIEKLKESYDLYNQNLKNSNELETLLKDKVEILFELETRVELLKELEKKIQKFRDELSKKESKENLKLIKEEIEDKINGLNIQYGVVVKELENLEERLKKSLKDWNEIKELNSLKLKAEKKLELTEKFRKNIKSMGEEVSSKIIKRISFFATENFRKITGRAESINWSNEDSFGKSEAYSVVLEGLDRMGKIRKTNFEQLSGGEQVAVAIAIRGAMINLFTKTRFSIFDEPTNNLDIERRKSLADNIGEILQDLEQSIIVTHDDTFKEMAQKVIEL